MQRNEVLPGLYLCKLEQGVAYYFVGKDDFDRTHTEANCQNSNRVTIAYYREMRILHLLSGKEYPAQFHKIRIVEWDQLPRSYQLDAIASNLLIREKYYESIYGHKPEEVNNNTLKDKLFAVIGEATGALTLLKSTNRIHFVIEADKGAVIPVLEPVKSIGGNIPSYATIGGKTYSPGGFISCDNTKEALSISPSEAQLMWGNPSERTKQTISNQPVEAQQNNTMDLLSNIPGMNLNFGKLEPGRIAISMNGELAFKDKQGNYVTIQTEGTEKTRVDVGSLKFDVDFYKVPTQDLEEGDVILLDGELLITGKKVNGDYKFINPVTGATTNKLQRSNILGMYFYTKIISLFSMVGGEANGLGINGIDPLMLMLMSGQGGQVGVGAGGNDIGQLLVLSQLSKAKGNGDLSSMLPLLMMSGNGGSLNGGGIGQLLLMQAMSGGNGLNLFGGAKKKAAARPAAKNTTAKKSAPKRKTQAAG